MTDDGRRIEQKAKSIAASRFGENVILDLMKAQKHRPSDNYLTDITTTVDEYLVKLFQKVGTNHGSKVNGLVGQ